MRGHARACEGMRGHGRVHVEKHAGLRERMQHTWRGSRYDEKVKVPPSGDDEAPPP